MDNKVNIEHYIPALLGKLNDILVILSADEGYKIKWANYSRIKKDLGFSKEEIEDKDFLNFVNPTQINEFKKFLNKKRYIDRSIEIHLISKKKKKKIPFKITRNSHELLEREHLEILVCRNIEEIKNVEKKSEERIRELTDMVPEIKFWKLFNPKKYEEALQSSFEMLFKVMENIPQYIFWKDMNHTYLGCNTNYAKLLGYRDPEKLMGKTDKELLFNEIKRKKLMELENDVLTQGIPIYNNIDQWSSRDGILIWFNTTYIPLKNSDGITVGLLATFEDITERKKSQEILAQSEKKYRELLESSSVGVLEVDLDKEEVSYINPKLEKITGYGKSEALNLKKISEIIHPEDRNQIFKIPEEQELEFRIIDKRGEIKWLRGTSVKNYENNTRIKSIRYWVEDITEKKMYESLIYELNTNFLNFSENTYENIQQLLQTSTKLLKADSVFYIQKFKKGLNIYYRIIGDKEDSVYQGEEVFKNRLVFNQFFQLDHDYPHYIRKHEENRELFEDDEFIQNKGYKSVYGKLIKSKTSENSLVCAFFKKKENPSIQDKLVLFIICDAIEVEQRRWVAQQHLEEQNRFKSELLTRTSHELKTPLISIKGFTDLLLMFHSDELNPKLVEILQNIRNGTKRLEALINSLIKSQELEQEQIELRPKEYDLKNIIQEAVDSLKGVAGLRKQTIIVEVDRESKIIVDKEFLFEILSNLILNAVKYTPPNGEIKIKSEYNDRNYIISIEDNGIGINPNEIKKLFKRFGKIERYGQGWDIKSDGSGLGLFISKRLVELHGGEIWVESEGRNQGSTFSFTIPYEKTKQ